jgi:dTDP-glucose 4,6-dehydratase/UDP-glucuronate decarboxylase
MTAADIVARDLADVAERISAEFGLMAGKKLLIVGGAGFLGYYLVQAPLAWNKLGKGLPVSVTVYDNYIRGEPDWLLALEDDPNLTLVRHDVTEPMPDDGGDFDYIVHAAQSPRRFFYRRYPIETMDANVNGLRHLLQYALNQKKKGKPLSGFSFLFYQ